MRRWDRVPELVVGKPVSFLTKILGVFRAVVGQENNVVRLNAGKNRADLEEGQKERCGSDNVF